MGSTLDIRSIWKQRQIPVVLRRGGKGERLRIRLPFEKDNRSWLLNGRSDQYLNWDKDRKYWEAPKAWFDDFVERAIAKFGKIYIVQPYREQEICAEKCMNARGHECNCSCMGSNHGSGNDGSWFEVAESFAVRWGERSLACRLLMSK